MNVLDPLEMIIITPPRMGTRALSNLIIRGKMIEHAVVDNYRFMGEKTRTTFYHTYPACLRNAPNMFNLVEQDVKKELAPLFRERYSYYTWVSTIRHPVARYASIISWHLDLGDEYAANCAKKWLEKPQTCFHMDELDTLLNIDKIVGIDYWVRTEHMAEDVMNIPQLKEKILDESNSFAAKEFQRIIVNNRYKSSNTKSYVTANDIPRKTWNYFYFKYKEVYEKFGYEKYRVKEDQFPRSEPKNQRELLLHHS